MNFPSKRLYDPTRTFIMICTVLVVFFIVATVVLGQTPPPAPPIKAGIDESTNQEEVKGVSNESNTVKIGELLFADTLLSANRKVACLTCHSPEKAYGSDGLPDSLTGGKLPRKAPSILNRAEGKFFFWDGRAKTLEEQALMPIENPAEMGLPIPQALERLRGNEKYARLFNSTFPDGITSANLARCLADYERTLKTNRNRLDEYLTGRGKLTEQEARGWNLFRGPARCYKCHTGANFTDDKFHTTGIGYSPLGYKDKGRYDVTLVSADIGKFKTPGLRECRKMSPYMHNASLKTLREVLRFYNRGGERTAPNLDPDLIPLGLREAELADLEAFLRVL